MALTEKLDVNTLYKTIKVSTAPAVLERISANLSEIINGEYAESNRDDYQVSTHKYPFNPEAYEKAKSAPNFRKEEWMCKMCMGRTLPLIGTIVDYQVPLKHNRKGCEGMGKVDLLSRNGDTAYLLELKVPDSTEPPLRAIMEIYTYWKQLGGNNSEHFLSHSAAKGAVQLKKAIVLFEQPAPAIYGKLKEDSKALVNLMEKLDVECFIAILESDDSDKIVGIKPCKL